MTDQTAATRALGKGQPTSPSEMRAKNGPTFVCMGRSGAGKTTLLETLNDRTEYTPVCVLDIDRKAHVLTDRRDRDIWPCHDWATLDDKVQALVAQRLHPVYKTVCFDGGTALQQILSYGKHEVAKTDNPQLRQTRYGNSNLDMVGLAQNIRILAEAGMHIIINIWAVREVEEGTNIEKWTPDITPTLLNRFLGLMDFVVGLEPNSQPKPYPPVMYWGGSQTRATRAAISPESPLVSMPDVIYKPSWADIFDSYHGKPFPADKHQKG